MSRSFLIFSYKTKCECVFLGLVRNSGSGGEKQGFIMTGPESCRPTTAIDIRKIRLASTTGSMIPRGILWFRNACVPFALRGRTEEYHSSVRALVRSLCGRPRHRCRLGQRCLLLALAPLPAQATCGLQSLRRIEPPVCAFRAPS